MKRTRLYVLTLIIVLVGACLVILANGNHQNSPRFVDNWGTVENWELSKQNATVISQQEKGSYDETTTINFSLCNEGVDSFGFGFGSTTFRFLGIAENKCHFYMGTEIESPTWNGYLDRECFVPTDYKTEFVTTDSGADLTFNKQYCTD